MRIPPILCLKPAIKKGGKDSTPTRMAINVVPQKKATAANASHAENFSDLKFMCREERQFSLVNEVI